MIVGEEVVVERVVDIGPLDPYGQPAWVDTGDAEQAEPAVAYETVHNVLVAPGPRTDVVDSIRPKGVKVVYTLHFPKPYAASLRGARISVRGQPALDVVGDPRPYTAENTPGDWWMPVEIGKVLG